MAFRPIVFRPNSGRVIAVLTVAACLVGLVGMFWFRGDPEYAIRSVGAVALLAAVSIAVFWMPKIDVREDEIEVRNVFTTAHVPWSAIRSIETRWSLVFVTDRGKVTAWASPSARRPMAGTDFFLRSMGTALPRTVGEPPPRPRDDVVETIHERWSEMADRDRLDTPGAGTGPRRSVHLVTIIVLGVLLLATVLGVTL
jgi:hypothetical protein